MADHLGVPRTLHGPLAGQPRSRRREVLTEALRVAPGLADWEISEMRVGLRPLSADGLPVLGAIPGVDGVFVATGHGPSGLQLGPYSAKIVAEMMLGGKPAVDLTPFRVDRFQV